MTDIEIYKKKELDSDGEEIGMQFTGPSDIDPFGNMYAGLLIGGMPLTGIVHGLSEGDKKSLSPNSISQTEGFKLGAAIASACVPPALYLMSGSFPLAFGYGVANWLAYKAGVKQSLAEQEGSLESKLITEETK